MDVAKYIGLFLLKNQYCYVHGLGNLELVKRPARHDGQALQAPYYEVVLNQSGSIDDNLANFIATNEQISISKAANTLRDFSMHARELLAAGTEITVPHIGRFCEERGVVKFVTDPAFRFTPPGVPVIKNSRQLDEMQARPLHQPSYPTPARADSVNWSMVILVIVLLVILGGGGFGIYYYMSMNSTPAVTTPPTVVHDTVKPAPAPVAIDTLKKDSVASAPAPVAAMDSNFKDNYKMVIGSYATRTKADRRQAMLKLNNTITDVYVKDSTCYWIIETLHCRPRDTTHVMDSLRRMFGYKGVMILR